MTVLRFDPRPAYELILTLVAYTTPQRMDSYDAGAGWFARVDGAISSELQDRVHRLTGGCDHVLTRLLGIAMDLPPPGTAEALLARLSTMPPPELRLALLGYYAKRARRRAATATFEAAARGNDRAARKLIDDLSDGPECELALAGLLAMTDQEAADLLVSALRDWTEAVFRDHLAAVGPLLEQETERLRARAAELPIDAFLDEVTRGADVVPGPGLDEIEIFPTWVLRPWNVFWEHGASLLLGVPVQDEHLPADPDAPPQRLVEVTRALGDERRLRILRRLTAGAYSLQELADHFGIPKTTLLHHLVILRSAGIVRVGPGASGKYSLRPGMSLELHRLLERYLPAVRREPLPVGLSRPPTERS